jgi:protein-histidine pros-kinase
VSEQVLARNVIANSRDQMRAILNAAPDAILTVDPNQKIVSFNPAATDLFGWTQEEIIGQSIQALIPQELRRRHFDQVARYVGDPSAKTGPMSAARIVYAQRKDGTTFPALISLATYRVNGRDMVTATAHDMSETVRVNQELTLLSDQLRRQLEDANEANEAKTRFLAHMSHELRTPLNAIIGFADMLSTFGVEKLGAERSNDYVSDIKSSGEHLLSLINDILDLSKIEAGETEIWIQDVACGDIIDAAVAGMHPVFQNYGVSVEIDRAVVPTVACDRRLTYQSLLNLMSNAAKFSPPNGTVTVRMRPERGGVRIDVIDRGPGISAELQNRIGEPFLRNDDPWTAQTEGSGLGLAITKSIVERQSGRFEIRSGPEGGTTASVWLPSSTSDAVVEDHAETPQRRFG